MTTSIPNSPIAFMEQQRLHQAQEQGFSMFAIKADGDIPGFVYTIGMAQHDLPELLCYFSDEEMGPRTLTLVSNVAHTMIESTKRFGASQTLRTMIALGIKATDPEILYRPTLLTGQEYVYALKTVLTRAVMFRNELGMPRVLELRHDGVPTIGAVQAQYMLRNS